VLISLLPLVETGAVVAFLSDQASLDKMIASAPEKEAAGLDSATLAHTLTPRLLLGVEMRVLSKAQALEIEPALGDDVSLCAASQPHRVIASRRVPGEGCARDLNGAVQFPADLIGDCRGFTESLAKVLECWGLGEDGRCRHPSLRALPIPCQVCESKYGVEFQLGTRVMRLEVLSTRLCYRASPKPSSHQTLLTQMHASIGGGGWRNHGGAHPIRQGGGTEGRER
jgi:hypothetical protein